MQFAFHTANSQIKANFYQEGNKGVAMILEDSVDLSLKKREILLDLEAKGFISAVCKAEAPRGDTLSFRIIPGQAYQWENLRFSSEIPPTIQSQISNDKIDPSELVRVIERTLSFYENVGFPFVTCFLDSININEGNVSAVVEVQKNEYVIWDTLEIKGTQALSKKTITRLINFKKGEAYNEKFLKELPKVLNSLPFISMIRAPEVYFYKGKASLILYLSEKKNNRFDGIVGINPNENSAGIELVGEANVELRNVLKRAEKLTLSWEKIKENSQRFQVGVNYPFLLGSKLGIDSKLDYFRQDTSFANLDATLAFSYFIDNTQSFTVGWNYLNSNSLGSVDGLASIPSNNSFTANYLRMGFESRNIDNPYNPRKGSEINFVLLSGFKTINLSDEITDVGYQNLSENTRQFRLDFELTKYIPLLRKSTIKLKITSGNLIGQNIFFNELYQLGGLNSLRGFNQQSLFASNYYFGTTEFRYLFDRSSAVFLFVEGGFYESNRLGIYENGVPFGTGFGVDFATKSGIFTLTYALGTQNSNPILIRNGKVHFGYISLF